MAKLELFFPIKPFTITQGFAENLVPYYKDVLKLKGHTGIDMVGITGQIVRAAHDGEVTYVGYDSNEGQGIVVLTDQEFDAPPISDYWTMTFPTGMCRFKSIYWHLLPDSAKVKVGDHVKAGDILAECDSTGVLQGVKFGPDKLSHLHFGLKPQVKGEADWIWQNADSQNGYGGAIDPAPYWNNFFAADLFLHPVISDIITTASQIVPQISAADIPKDQKLSLFDHLKVVLAQIEKLL